MKIVVPIKLVPDLVEELEIDGSGTALDTAWLRLIINEVDEHALEQALLLKERAGGEVTVVTLEGDDADDVLFAAAAKGADNLIRLTGIGFEDGHGNHALARLFASVVAPLEPDLVLTGVQAHDDLDGSLGPLLAEEIGMPYVGYLSGVAVDGGSCVVKKEYPGGLAAEMEVKLPAVLGIQAAEEPPRYLAISRIRQAMKTSTVDDHEAGEPDGAGAPAVVSMTTPEVGERATMLSGSDDEIAAAVLEILRDQGVL
jgi:electron transfer flavoprotein beta subunit